MAAIARAPPAARPRGRLGRGADTRRPRPARRARPVARAAPQGDSAVVDESAVDQCLKEVSTALLQSDVNVKLVMSLRENVKKAALAGGDASNRRRLLQQAVFKELAAMLNPGVEPYRLDRRKKDGNVVMFVGLQGAGKTTTCTKYARYYAKKGFKVGLVCADTFRAGAFDQLKQNATKAGIPFYGSYTETDPSTIARDGVAKFRELGMSLIIVDTSGRHKQEAALFEEMEGVQRAVEPDEVVFVMDSHIGQSAADQASAFKASVNVGSVIVTKMDGHAKGGGAISAVAATQSPITFVGVGEHVDEFERFEAKGFVSKLLGMGDMMGLMDKVTDIVGADEEKQMAMVDTLTSGVLTFRIMKEQFSNISGMGPLSSVMSMIPGMKDIIPQGADGQMEARFKRFNVIMDSLSEKEMDDTKPSFDEGRIRRIARGAGVTVSDVHVLIEEFKRMSKMFAKMKGFKLPKHGGPMSQLTQNMNANTMSQMLPPQLLKQMGGAQGMQQMMKAISGGKLGDLGGLGNLASMLG